MIRCIVLAGLCFLFSCADPVTEPANKQEKSDQPYFPVYAFLKGEQNAVDSLPGGIQQILTRNGTIDSSYITHESFHTLTDPFLVPELQPGTFEESFKEESFYDQTLKSSNFLYTPRNTSTSIRRIDISTQTKGVYDKVVSLYIEQETTGPEGVILNKLLWRPGKEFQLITIPSGENTAGEEYHRRVIWDNFEETP